jgi:hypothetical protein
MMQKYEPQSPKDERASIPYPRWCFAPGVPLRNAVADAMSMPTVTAVMACAGVKPIPMSEDPMVHDERQMPQVPTHVSFNVHQSDDRQLTPITHVRINAIRPLVVSNRVNISVTPSTRLNLLVLIVGRLDFEPLE